MLLSGYNKVADIDYRIYCLYDEREFFASVADTREVSRIEEEIKKLRLERISKLTSVMN